MASDSRTHRRLGSASARPIGRVARPVELRGDRQAIQHRRRSYQRLRKHASSAGRTASEAIRRSRTGGILAAMPDRLPTTIVPLAELEAARDRIAGIVHRTPLLSSATAAAWTTAATGVRLADDRLYREGRAPPEDRLVQGARDDQPDRHADARGARRAARSRCRRATRARPTPGPGRDGRRAGDRGDAGRRGPLEGRRLPRLRRPRRAPRRPRRRDPGRAGAHPRRRGPRARATRSTIRRSSPGTGRPGSS